LNQGTTREATHVNRDFPAKICCIFGALTKS
jgi:hypothetical protein